MTRESIVRSKYKTSVSDGSNSFKSELSSTFLPMFHEKTSVVKIGSVKIRFTQNLKKNDYYVNTTKQQRETTKCIEDEELNCCGVLWPPSCNLLTAYSNNRNRISLRRNSDKNEERRNFILSPVCRCTSEWSERVPFVRPALINCFGKQNLKSCAKTDKSGSGGVINVSDSEGEVVRIVSESERRLLYTFDENYVYECVRRSDSDHSIYDCEKCSLIVFDEKESTTVDTLDRLQKFRFGGDRTGRNAGRRGSGGSHKKKAQRNSDKSINLKKLTDKLKQNSSTHPEEVQNTAVTSSAGFIIKHDEEHHVDENKVSSTILTCSSQSPQSISSPTNNPVSSGVLISLKNDDYGREKDDIFDGVNLKLSKPESRTIIGSYYQRSIPFRSASFSQIHYSPEDRKYIRNCSRKTGSFKRSNNPLNVENSATLPRTNSSSVSCMPAGNQDATKSKLNIDEEKSKFCLFGYTFSCDENEKKSDAIADVSLAEVKNENEPNQSLNVESTEVITTSVICANVSSHTNKSCPQVPRRVKHKHKYRQRHCGRLYSSDENIFSPCAEGNECENEDVHNRVESVENICVTITTPRNSDIESEKGDNEATIVKINFVNEPMTSQVSNKEEEMSKEGNTENSAFTDSSDKAKTKCPILEIEEASMEVNVSNNDKMGDTLLVNEICNQTSPSSPEDSLKLQWPTASLTRSHRLTPQTSVEKDDDLESDTSRKYQYPFSRGDSYSEAESDQGDKRSVSPGTKDYRLSPLPYTNHELSDSDSRSSANSKGLQSPVPYSKRPLRGPYLEMIFNEQKKPENTKNNLKNAQFFENRNRILGNDYAVDDYYLRRGNTTSSSNRLDVISRPKRKISANIPFCEPVSLRPISDEKTLIHHQRTTSSPSQLEYYPDQLSSHQHDSVPSQQLLHQLLRGSSEHSLVQDVDLLKKMYPTTSTYKDTRSHIVVELYDTERSYVESLQILVTKYLQPLKSPECTNLIESYVVEEIFYKIPEILAYHEIFLEELRIRLEGWNKSKCIGDIFLETFTKPAVIHAYIAFVNNWKNAKESIKQTCHTKPAFARFLETMTREHKGKLALDSLLIMPVQRIPRYELLIQSLLKHTELCHPDYNKLQEALRQVHELAMRINCTERDSLELEQIENLIDGLANLVTGDRTFLRYDLVSMTSGQGPSRKERALFLFNDLIIITSVKRRSSTVKKPILSSPGSITSSLEANKYKLLMKIPLEHLDIVKVKDENLRRMMREMEYLTEDVNTLSQMVDLVATLHCPHGQIEENIREMLSALNKQLNDRHVSESQLSYLELALNTRNSVENVSIIFPKPENRTNWEETFLEAKSRLNVSGDRRLNPEFLTSVPIRKTRAGLQFTCAAASYNQRDVWVCNSDGYVGQVCILSLNPEPAVTSCNGVCNARILSVTSVPVSRYLEKSQDNLSSISNTNTLNALPKISPNEEINESIPVENLEHDIPDIYLNSSSSSEEEEEDESPEDQKSTENSNFEFVDSTMWLGTEDGVVHIYNCADSLRIKRNRLKIQHNSAVYCILYVEKSVFVSLANGEVHMYNWCASFGWNTTDPTIISVGSVTAPVSRMFLVCGKLWCLCHNIIKPLNIHTLHVENAFTVIGENNRAITSVAVSGFSVYLSLQNSAVLRVVHGMTYEILSEINIAPAVTKMLSGVDDIIRQHKAACLRVTSLLACKELLWIGTSAGVILTMPLPTIKQDTAKINNIPHPVGLPHGHTGHVRFLTAVKYRNKKKDISGRRSSKTLDRKPDPSTTNKMLIISGGDGYEDFRSSSVSEIAGREDSTNHLLIWRF